MDVSVGEEAEIEWDASSVPMDKDMLLQTETSMIDMRRQDSLMISGEKSSFVIVLKDRVPTKPELLQNYPNPFNPETWIPFELSNNTKVEIMIYTSSGQLVRRLDLGHKPAGSYIERDKSAYWDGKNEVGEYVGSGIYFYTIKAGNFVATRKMVMMK